MEQPTTVETEPVVQEEPTVVPTEELEEEAGQADPVTPHPDPVTPHPAGAKTKPITRSATKQGPSKEAPASSKRPTKTPVKGSSSKKPRK